MQHYQYLLLMLGCLVITLPLTFLVRRMEAKQRKATR